MHSPILETRQFNWPDEAACAAFAEDLARQDGLREACIELRGPLGAGKTTFVRHLLRALGATGRIKSPTYAVVEPYDLPRMRAWHFDFYRFSDPREWEDAGFRDLFASPGLKLCEWPEKVAGLMPLSDMQIELTPSPDGSRLVTLHALTPAGVALMGPLGAACRAA